MIRLDDARRVICAAESWPGWLFPASSAVETSNARAVNALLMEILMLPSHAPSILTWLTR